MPRNITVTLEDGTTHVYQNAPDDITPDAVTARAQKDFGKAVTALDGGRKASAPAAQEPQATTAAAPIGMAGRIVQGIRDPIDGAAQLLSHAVSDTAFGRGMNKLGEKLGMAPGDPASMDANLAQREQQYQAARRAAMPKNLTSLVTGQQEDPGFDGARLTGNLMTALIPGSAVARAATLPGRIGAGMASGAALASTQPVTQGDFAEEKAKQVALGAATGGALPAVGAAAARVISPQVRESVRTLINDGVRPTIGQTLGGAFKTAEEKLSSVPILGGAIRSGMANATEDFNRAAVNRALGPIGQELPRNIGTGRDAVAFARRALSEAYDETLNRIGAVRADPALRADLTNLGGMIQNAPKEIGDQFNRIMQNEVMARLQGGVFTSEGLKAAESNLGNLARNYARSQDYDQRVLGQALDEAQNSLRQFVTRVARPEDAARLRSINQGYANFKRVQRAASGLGADEGTFSAAQLQNAVKALDRTKDKRAFSEGGALMQDLSEAGREVLANRVPNSGTADRAFVIGSLLNPMLAVGAAAPSVLYARPVQNALVRMLTERPQGAQALANATRQLSTRVAPALAQVTAAQRGQ